MSTVTGPASRPRPSSAMRDRTPWVFDFADGDRSQVDLLGGKGANLAEMT